jgi:hypothetical protein
MDSDGTAEALALIRSTDWARLSHAYGPAKDTPLHLEVLATGGEAEARSAALSHLWGAVLHQGSLSSATPAAARVVAALLAAPQTGAPAVQRMDLGEDPLPLRASLLNFLAEFADSSLADSRYDLEEMARVPGREAEIARLEANGPDEDELPDEDLFNAVYARAILAGRALCPSLVNVALPLLGDAAAAVRVSAAHCVATLSRHTALAGRRASFIAAIEHTAGSAGPKERAALVLSLGELRADTSSFLKDPDPAVRCCAALAPTQAHNSAATREILAALQDPAGADRWLPRVPQLDGWLRFTLVREAISRTASFDDLLPAALEIARGPAHVFTVSRDWGPLLAAAFPTPPAGRLSDAQRAYLAALVDNEMLWDPRNGNADLLFRQLGVPYDREACRALLGGGSQLDPGARITV